MNRGVLYALFCYGLWGILPVYWKALQSLTAGEILAHRMIWSLVLLLAVLTVRRQWGWMRTLSLRTVLTFCAITLLLAVNWFVYIWAVNRGAIVETSLGYFINPLVNVLLGRLFLGEQLRRGQVAAISIAALGVLYLTVSYGSLPWIALTLAFSFGCYGLLKKTARLNALEGFTLEMMLAAPLVLAYLLYLSANGSALAPTASPAIWGLLLGAGLVTALPLVSFAAAARRLRLTTLGLFQYLAPTIQFLLGVFLYNEPFSTGRAIGFAAIWLALALYSTEGLWYGQGRRRRAVLTGAGLE